MCQEVVVFGGVAGGNNRTDVVFVDDGGTVVGLPPIEVSSWSFGSRGRVRTSYSDPDCTSSSGGILMLDILLSTSEVPTESSFDL